MNEIKINSGVVVVKFARGGQTVLDATDWSGTFSFGGVGVVPKFRGVYWEKCSGKWKAQIRKEGKQFALGSFEIEAHAAKAYDEAARKMGFDSQALNF